MPWENRTSIKQNWHLQDVTSALSFFKLPISIVHTQTYQSIFSLYQKYQSLLARRFHSYDQLQSFVRQKVTRIFATGLLLRCTTCNILDKILI